MKSPAKEKSPAGDKLPEILSQWQQNFQLLVRQKSAAEIVRQEIICSSHCSEFLNGNFSQAGPLLKPERFNPF